MRWVGGATVGQLEKLFADGERAVRGGAKGAAQALARGRRALRRGSVCGGGAGVPRGAEEATPVSSPEYARAVDALLFACRSTKQYGECSAAARGRRCRGCRRAPRPRTSPARARLRAEDARGRAGTRRGDRRPSRREARAIVDDPRIPLAADDRSALYCSLVDAREDAKDAAGREGVGARVGRRTSTREAAAVKTPEQRTALDPNRLGAFEAAGEIEKAIPMLEQSEKDFPDDYNPPARLALVYKELKRYDEALAASDRALAQGLRPSPKIRVLAVRADIYEGMGDAAAARKTLEEAIAYAESAARRAAFGLPDRGVEEAARRGGRIAAGRLRSAVSSAPAPRSGPGPRARSGRRTRRPGRRSRASSSRPPPATSTRRRARPSAPSSRTPRCPRSGARSSCARSRSRSWLSATGCSSAPAPRPALPAARLESERARTVSQVLLFAELDRGGLVGRARASTARCRTASRSRGRTSGGCWSRSARWPSSARRTFRSPSRSPAATRSRRSRPGCPVVVKAHPAHPGTSELVGLGDPDGGARDAGCPRASSRWCTGPRPRSASRSSRIPSIRAAASRARSSRAGRSSTPRRCARTRSRSTPRWARPIPSSCCPARSPSAAKRSRRDSRPR